MFCHPVEGMLLCISTKIYNYTVLYEAFQTININITLFTTEISYLHLIFVHKVVIHPMIVSTCIMIVHERSLLMIHVLAYILLLCRIFYE